MKQKKASDWSVDQSAEIYGVKGWGAGFFDLNKQGEVVVNLKDGDKTCAVSLPEIVSGLRDRGMGMPVLLRFGDLLRARITELNESFRAAIQESGYQGVYRGVYPIKVNQQKEVIEEITRFGRKYHYGLEAGSKPELIAALAYMHDPEAYIVCNGYKDEEFIDLALYAVKMGLQVVIVLEMPTELELVLQRCEALGVKPTLGVRIRLTTQGSGHWEKSGGEQSVFGLNISQVISVVDTLRERKMLDCLKLLHYHQGSQIPNIRAIRQAATEAARVYAGLVQEGAAMGIMDLGGGLAISYDGLKSNSPSSSNYGMKEYCVDVLEAISEVVDEAKVPHPNLISESGRAVVAYSSVLVVNILDVNSFQAKINLQPDEAAPPILRYLHESWEQLRGKKSITADFLREAYNDAVYYRDKIRSEFNYGKVALRHRAQGEELYWEILNRLSDLGRDFPEILTELQRLDTVKTDCYYGNFSVFQSLPDFWAIDQLFPVMPIHRLDERPDRTAVLSDITCDSDGKIDKFIQDREVVTSLPLHRVTEGEDYMLAIFLVGAYQETLGDLHNLLGDTNVASVQVVDGQLQYIHEQEGDSVSEVLSYVEYDPKDLARRFRRLAETAVSGKRLSAAERKIVTQAYEEGLRGYTYFES